MWSFIYAIPSSFYYGLFHTPLRTFVPIPLFSSPFHVLSVHTSRSKFWYKTNYYISFFPVSGFSDRILAKCQGIWTENSKIFPNIHRQIRYVWILWDVSWRLSSSTSVTIGRTRLVSIPSRATIWKKRFFKYFERNKVKLQKKVRKKSYMQMRICPIRELCSMLRLFRPRGNWHISLLNNAYYILSRLLVTEAKKCSLSLRICTLRLTLLRLLESRECYNLF